MNPVVEQANSSSMTAIEPKTASRAHPINRNNQWKLLMVVLIAVDASMVYLAFSISYWVRFASSLTIFQRDVIPLKENYNLMILVFIPGWLLIFAMCGLYSRQNCLLGTRETALLLKGITIGIFLVMATDFLETNLALARGWLLVSWLAAFLLTNIARFGVRRLVHVFRRHDLFLSSAMIVGANSEARLLAEQFIRQEYSGLKLIGFVDNSLPVNTPIFHDLRIMGTIENIESLVRDHDVEEVILATSAIHQTELLAIFQKFGVSKSVNLHLSSGLYEIIATGFQMREFASVPLVGLNKVRMTGAGQVAKLLMDYVITIPALILLMPVFAVVAILIKTDSAGPIFYRRRVMGVNGRQFDAFKFRTMFCNGSEILDSHPELIAEYKKKQKLKNDPRITRVGKFLRKTSIDELPQLFNVLRNEMSLVGPRMICPDEMTFYQQAGINLLTVKPGITGLWQVSGRSEISYESRVQLDMYYIRNWTIWLDLHLLWRTIPAVLSKRGAY